MEAEKSHDLVSYELETQESRWCHAVQVRRPETWGANGVNPSPRAGGDETKCHSSAVRQE